MTSNLTDSSVISPTWLLAHLDDPAIVIADCRFSLADPDLGYQHYQTAHIPGAHYFHLNQDLSSPISLHGGRHPLPDPDHFVAKLNATGIYSRNGQDSTLVVAYDDSRFAFAARLWWLLRYYGHDRAVILNGGFQQWRAAGYPVSEAIPDTQPGQFIPQIQSDWAVDIDRIKALTERAGVILIDSRERARYRGETEPIDPVAGHIPGALNYPWQEVTDEQGWVRSPLEQVQRWRDIQDADQIIVYCGSGVTACVNLLSLDLAGIPNAKLYPGSWSDWCSYLVED